MGRRSGKANMKAARRGAEKGDSMCHGGLPVIQLKESMFFSEEKNQKTFTSGAHGKIPAMASIAGVAEE
jgi:hypothetical protein